MDVDDSPADPTTSASATGQPIMAEVNLEDAREDEEVEKQLSGSPDRTPPGESTEDGLDVVMDELGGKVDRVNLDPIRLVDERDGQEPAPGRVSLRSASPPHTADQQPLAPEQEPSVLSTHGSVSTCITCLSALGSPPCSCIAGVSSLPSTRSGPRMSRPARCLTSTSPRRPSTARTSNLSRHTSPTRSST